MGKYCATYQIDKSELDEIMAELDKAKETIYKCYSRLQDLEVLTLREDKDDAASGN